MMQFDWTTFILEILNFLVLVWILKRWFYKPILTILDARQQKIKDETARAEQLLSQADALRQQYELCLLDWENERQLSRNQLEDELAQALSSGLEKVKQTLADEEAKLRSRHQALAAAREAAQEWEAANAAYENAAAMLQRLASPQLTQSIVDIFLEDLSNLSETDQSALRKAASSLVAASAVEIISSHALHENMRLALAQALSAAAGQTLEFSFNEDPALIAGVRAMVGECQLHANLADELRFFRRQASHD